MPFLKFSRKCDKSCARAPSVPLSRQVYLAQRIGLSMPCPASRGAVLFTSVLVVRVLKHCDSVEESADEEGEDHKHPKLTVQGLLLVLNLL